MKKLIWFVIVLLGCNEKDYYHVEIIGNTKTITRRSEGEIGTYIDTYNKIEVLKLRVDDDSEYHLTYKRNGRIYSDKDLSNFRISIIDGIGDSWVSVNPGGKYQVIYSSNKIEYFED